MSFILDALKKSQATRQRHAGPGTVAVETAPGAPQPHNWWAIVIAIVAINISVLTAFVYWSGRGDRDQRLVSASAQPVSPALSDASRPLQTTNGLRPPQRPQTSPRRGEVLPLSAEVREPRSAGSTESPVPTSPVNSGAEATTQSAPVIQPSPAADSDYLPTLAELQLENRIALSPLHVDVHVYNADPQRRFVLVNSRKYKEGERLSEGPLLEAIRRDGLVMYYRGERFLVPRE